MLSMKEIKPNVFELKETIMGWDKDTITYWYWDLIRKLISEMSDFPDSMRTRVFSDNDLTRFENFYRPLLKPNM